MHKAFVNLQLETTVIFFIKTKLRGGKTSPFLATYLKNKIIGTSKKVTKYMHDKSMLISIYFYNINVGETNK